MFTFLLELLGSGPKLGPHPGQSRLSQWMSLVLWIGIVAVFLGLATLELRKLSAPIGADQRMPVVQGRSGAPVR